MDNIKKINMWHLFYIVVIAVVVLFSIDLMIPNPNPSLIFEGNSESFNLNGHNAKTNFKTDIVYFMSDISVFRSVKNISITNKNGNVTFISSSNVEVFYNENRYEMLLYGHTDLYIDDFTIIRHDINRIQIDGNLNQNSSNVLKSDGCTITITNSEANSVLIEGNEFKNFNAISFELDNTSHIQLVQGTIKIDAYGISETRINGQLSNEFALDMSEGKLRLDDQSFNVINTDDIDGNINSNYPASFEVEDIKMSLKATVDSVTMNGNNIIMSKIIYWFNQQTEKINAFATVILVIITAMYAYDNNRMIKQTNENSEIAFIEKRLEKLYYPLMDVLQNPVIMLFEKEKYGYIDLDKIDKIVPFQYLASENIVKLVENFVNEAFAKRLTRTLTEATPFDKYALHTIVTKNIKTKVNEDIEIYKNELEKLIRHRG